MLRHVAGASRGAADERRDSEKELGSWLAPASALAAVSLGRALQIANGTLEPNAAWWLVFTFAVIAIAVLIPRPRRFAAVDAGLVTVIGIAGLALQILQLWTTPPGMYVDVKAQTSAIFMWGLVGLGVCGGALVFGLRGRAKAAVVIAFVAAHSLIGAWIVRHTPPAIIDVEVFNRESIDALRAGQNPYAITFPNIYNDDLFYAKGVSINRRLHFGFPYPPMSLLLAAPGRLLAGDHRYASLAAMGLAALLMAFAQPTERSFGAVAAVLYLTSPRIFFVLEESWTEPFVVLGLAAVVFAACRRSRALPWLFGAFVALKQYMVFAIPAAVLLLARPTTRRHVLQFFTAAAIVGTVVTLPFFLWNPSAFWNSVVTLQFRQPFRDNSLTALAWWVQKGHAVPGPAVTFIAGGIASALAVWRLPRTAAGFAAAIATTFFVFFAFSKQAFSNYYFFAIGALCITLASCGRVQDARHSRSST